MMAGYEEIEQHKRDDDEEGGGSDGDSGLSYLPQVW